MTISLFSTMNFSHTWASIVVFVAKYSCLIKSFYLTLINGFIETSGLCSWLVKVLLTTLHFFWSLFFNSLDFPFIFFRFMSLEESQTRRADLDVFLNRKGVPSCIFFHGHTPKTTYLDVYFILFFLIYIAGNVCSVGTTS